MEIFAERLKELRQVKQKTQKDVAVFLGITTSSYQKYELNDREPNLEMLNKLADYFCTSADYLLGRTDTPN